MADSHIILLPEVNYYKWVKATRTYVLTFGVNITPDPVKAGQYEHITVAVVPQGYPDHGNIVSWLRDRFPDAHLDTIYADAPQDLNAELDRRVAEGKAYTEPKKDTIPVEAPEEIKNDEDVAGREAEVKPEPLEEPFRLVWPTDYPVITQGFAANPEIYSKWGLPGHEGLDIRAPMNTNVYAGADGEVFLAVEDANIHPYGRHVRIRHEGGYRTIYGHLASMSVKQGDMVKAGQLIGKADSTGNSTGSHLHLTLKKDGASARQETQFQGDVIDPTPYLIHPQSPQGMTDGVSGIKPTKIYEYGWNRPALIGANVRDDGTMAEADYKAVETARLEAVKVQENTSSTVLERLKTINADMFIVARIAYDLGQSVVTPPEWVSRMRTHVNRLYSEGVRYFEIHQSPNLQAYGWNYSWHSGGGFARWWLDVVGILRDNFADAKFGFPGVSPGGQVEGQRLDGTTFLEQADDALYTADWVGANCFWISEAEMLQEDKGAFWKVVRSRYPEKLMMITEFGNVNVLTNPFVKGNEYVKFYEMLRNEKGIAAAFAQVLSSPKGFSMMEWRDETGELTMIPERVGKRTFK